MQYPRHARLLHHSPNGGRRNIREGARFRAMGTKAGFPDLFLCLPSPTRGAHGLFIELKSEHGRQSPAQIEWESNCTRVGYLYKIVRNIDDFINVMKDYMMPIVGK